MPKYYVMLITALGVMVGHVGLLPYIFLYVDRPPMSERIDIAMIIGPLTAAYFVSIVHDCASSFSELVNLLYVLTSLFVVFPFIISIYGLLYMYQNADLEFGFVKSGIAVIELFLGAAFTMYIDSLFGKSA